MSKTTLLGSVRKLLRYVCKYLHLGRESCLKTNRPPWTRAYILFLLLIAAKVKCQFMHVLQ